MSVFWFLILVRNSGVICGRTSIEETSVEEMFFVGSRVLMVVGALTLLVRHSIDVKPFGVHLRGMTTCQWSS